MDCRWTDYGEWSTCPRGCGEQHKFRIREKIEHSCKGRACEGSSKETKPCNAWTEAENDLILCKASETNMTSEINRLQTKLCGDVVCQNGGTCFEGDCECAEGFEGQNCQTKSCSPKCENGGTCLGGSCSCKADFSGQYCQEKLSFGSCKDGYDSDGKPNGYAQHQTFLFYTQSPNLKS